MVLSSEAVRSEWPSLAKWTLLMEAVCALSTVDSPLLSPREREREREFPAREREREGQLTHWGSTA